MTAHVPLLYVKAVLSVINYSCLLNISQNVQQLQLRETEEEEMLPGGIPAVCVTVGQLVKPGSAMQGGLRHWEIDDGGGGGARCRLTCTARFQVRPVCHVGNGLQSVSAAAPHPCACVIEQTDTHTRTRHKHYSLSFTSATQWNSAEVQSNPVPVSKPVQTSVCDQAPQVRTPVCL